jgi:hypothetical protein
MEKNVCVLGEARGSLHMQREAKIYDEKHKPVEEEN